MIAYSKKKNRKNVSEKMLYYKRKRNPDKNLTLSLL